MDIIAHPLSPDGFNKRLVLKYIFVLHSEQDMMDELKYHTVLFVDDDADDHLLFKDALEFLPDKPAFYWYQCPLKALNDLKQRLIKPDLLWLDVNMPRMNGLDFISELKRDTLLNKIPFVVHSTCKEPKTKETALSLGAIDYIVKPNGFSLYKSILQRIFLL